MSASSDGARFTYRSARSGALTAGIAGAVLVESLVVHLWLHERHPGWAWASTALGALALLWLAYQYRAWGADALRMTADALHVAVPGGATVDVPRDAIAEVTRATWRALPDAPDAGYLNATAPAEPNVLVRLAAPVPARLVGGLVTKRVALVGLHLDEPEAFVRVAAGVDCG